MEFGMGSGIEVAVVVQCPYCGEPCTTFVDTSIPEQDYVEDCQVCCAPMVVTVTVGPDGAPAVTVRREDGLD